MLIAELLDHSVFQTVTSVKSGAEARRALSQNDFSLVIISAPLSDEFGNELSLFVSEQSGAGVILLVKSEIADEVSAKVENFGVFVVPRPLSRAFFYQALKLSIAAHNRVVGLRFENEKLQTKIEEIRLVDRAKCVLIEVLKLSEKEAHRYIEKQAMDMRTTRKEIAEAILKTYEL